MYVIKRRFFFSFYSFGKEIKLSKDAEKFKKVFTSDCHFHIYFYKFYIRQIRNMGYSLLLVFPLFDTAHIVNHMNFMFIGDFGRCFCSIYQTNDTVRNKYIDFVNGTGKCAAMCWVVTKINLFVVNLLYSRVKRLSINSTVFTCPFCFVFCVFRQSFRFVFMVLEVWMCIFLDAVILDATLWTSFFLFFFSFF